MFSLETETDMTIGVLPDVLEDTNITASELRELGFSE